MGAFRRKNVKLVNFGSPCIMVKASVPNYVVCKGLSVLLEFNGRILVFPMGLKEVLFKHRYNPPLWISARAGVVSLPLHLS